VRLHVYLPDDLVARVDASRGDVPRSKVVQRALEKALGEESAEGPTSRPASSRASANFGSLENRTDAFRRIS
jgi:metal-responsive CopG/Arc/MetJ family transcriptional regulator